MKTSQKEAFERIDSKRKRPWQGEEEVRLAWISALESVLNIHFDAERAKKDGSYNNVIIEFKAPGLFKGSKKSAKFLEATAQRLLPYITREAAKSGIPAEDYIGIAIDGEHICFAQVLNGSIQSQHLIPFSEYALGLVICAIQADTRRAITAENLMRDFGHGSVDARALMQALADALAYALMPEGHIKIKMLFEEWRTLYGQVADMSVLQSDSIEQEISFGWNGLAQHAMPGRLFVIHTYNSLLIKLLAAEIVSAHGLTAIVQPAQAMAALLDDSVLLETLFQDIERSAIFAQAGIKGFVEEAIFTWYLDVAKEPQHGAQLNPALRNVLAALSLYRTDVLTNSRDVLRDLYQGLVPGKLRQSLGEFYTPDWLVDFTLDQVQAGPWLNCRVLDPTCGSGAFLLAVLHRVKAEAAQAGWSSERILKHVCESVWGFDLNPLAVQTSRVNFLMDIAGLLKDAPGHALEIPILMADAIYSPAPNPAAGQDVMAYRIGSQKAKLDILLPSELALNRYLLDQVFCQMGDDVENNLEYDQAQARLLAAKLMTPAQAEKWQQPLKTTYDQILALHRQQWNGIWFRIVRNFFWSATAGKFDYVIGNPPWVRWSKLPDAYRERVKPTCESYGIFSKNKMHGGNELDISAMITYTTADKWLKLGGMLAFVITGSVFKNPSSAGFRHFCLEPKNPKSYHLAPIVVNDMKGLKPFADAANHTAMVVFKKTVQPGTYPVPYRLWQSVAGFSRAIPPTLPLAEVMQRVAFTDKCAAPVGAIGSPWAVLSEGRYAQLEALSGSCPWVAGRKGITTDLNGVYFVPIIKINKNLVQICSRPEAGKKDIGQVKTAWIEPALLYPLIKGAGDFEACYLRRQADLYVFVPNTGINGEHYSACETAMNGENLAKTRAWFFGFKTLLNDRSTYRRQMKGAPFYAVYNVGDYTFQPWKVVWPEMSTRFYAAVVGCGMVPLVGSRPYVPDHKIYFAGFDTKEPACFLCGLLNTPMVCEWVESHNVSIQMGDIFKHMTLPKFDVADQAHIALAALVGEAHDAHEKQERAMILRRIGLAGEAILQKWMAAMSAAPSRVRLAETENTAQLPLFDVEFGL